MNTETLPLSSIRENGANPRTITESKFSRLINSILSFPAMLDIRPIVVDDAGVILGGNMRYKALLHISQMDIAEIRKRASKSADREAVLSFWQSFLDRPAAPVIKASELTDEEKQRFIIEDNVPFGDWDWDKLANEWDSQDLGDWGLDLWKDTDSESEKSVEPINIDEEENKKETINKVVSCPKCGFEFSI